MTYEDKKKILIIDDQKSLVWGLEKFLTERGFEVESVFDGSVGLKRISEDHFDIIVMDLKLPGKTGLEILELSSNKTSAGFILISAFATAEDAEKAALLGAKDFLPKPFEPEELLERISNILYEHRSKDEKEQIKWVTLFSHYPVQIDVFYGKKNNFCIDVFENKKKQKGIFIGQHVSAYEMGYISAVLENMEDMSDLETAYKSINKRIKKDDFAALIDLDNKKVLLSNTKVTSGIWKENQWISKGNDTISVIPKEIVCLFSHDGISEDYSGDFLSSAGNRPSTSFLSYKTVRLLKNEIMSGPLKTALIIRMDEQEKTTRIEEDFPPESMSRNEIIRFVTSLPPSQFLSEVQRKKIDLLLCEVINTIEPEQTHQGLKMICDIKEHRIEKISFTSNGVPLLPFKSSISSKEMNFEKLGNISRKDIIQYIVNTLFKDDELEINDDSTIVSLNV